jgi:hypothetical protein
VSFGPDPPGNTPIPAGARPGCASGARLGVPGPAAHRSSRRPVMRASRPPGKRLSAGWPGLYTEVQPKGYNLFQNLMFHKIVILSVAKNLVFLNT